MSGGKMMMDSKTMDGKMMDGKMMECCREMMAQKKQMMETTKTQDTDLKEQLAKMKSAPEDKKMDLMAATLTLMAEQRIAMNAQKAKMEDVMMTHMMKHMQMGQGSMEHCPMMDMDEKSPGSGGDLEKTK